MFGRSAALVALLILGGAPVPVTPQPPAGQPSTSVTGVVSALAAQRELRHHGAPGPAQAVR